MKTKLQHLTLLAGMLASVAHAQTAPAPHSDSQYALELSRLQQIDLLQSQLAAAKGTPAENLWRAQLLQAQYEELTKDAAAVPKVTQDYLAALTAYIKSQTPANLDGAWALNHAQFILTRLSQPTLTRMEYFGNNRRDREALTPLSSAAEQMLRLAGGAFADAMKRLESAKPFDEKAYTRVYASAAEVRYYTAWAQYTQAMTLDPAAPERKKILSGAVETLAEWAVEQPDNGVNYQSCLLRGKVQTELGDAAKALVDFARAQSDKAPNWVQFQARYQTVVAQVRAGDTAKAQAALDAFKQWVPQGVPRDNAQAQLSVEMLGYRVAWAAAEKLSDSAARKIAQREALNILAAIIQRDVRYRDLVYEQLATQISEYADVNALYPLQQLALARTFSLNQKGDTPESRKRLTSALNAAAAVRNHPQATRADKYEAAFLLGVGNALMGNLAQAAGFEVEFATAAPHDPRARQMVDLALQQIGELRQAAATQGAGVTGGLSPEVRTLAAKALDLSTGTFGDKQWLYAQARLLEESAKPAEAAAIYEKIAADDRNYVDARYRLVVLATERFGKLEGKAAAGDQQKAAAELFAAAAKFVELLDKPPASAPKETLQAAQGYRYDIWLIEAATALSPAVRNSPVALERLTRLDAAGDKLTPAQRTTALRYRIQAYQLTGQMDKARPVIAEYCKTGAEAMAAIRSLALGAVDEIDKTTDGGEIRRLAGSVVVLLEPIIAAANVEGKKESAFEYQIIQAGMMVRAGQYQESQTLSVALQKQKQDAKQEDIRPFMIEARALFTQAQADADKALYAKAQDYFTRILARLAPGSENFWESWLRVIQAMEAQSPASAGEIKSRLGDLKAIYGGKFGGELFRSDFAKLAGKYGVGG